MVLRKERGKLSGAFAVQITFRICGGKTNIGTTCSRVRRYSPQTSRKTLTQLPPRIFFVASSP